MKPKSILWSVAAALLVLGGGILVWWRALPPSPSDIPGPPATDASRPLARERTEPVRTAEPAPAPALATDRTNSANAAARILDRLRILKVAAGKPQTARQVVLELERLREAGAAALPAIRAFLATGQDIDYDAALGRNLRGGQVPADFAIPPSLRLGLLETVKNIGGPDAERLLFDELKVTGRGVEVAYLAGVLQELAPGRYRDTALAAARDLLASPLPANAPSPLDRSDRDYLFGVLTSLKDDTYAMQARAQVVQPDGRVDRSALRYLQQTTGLQSLEVAAQAWADPRVPAAQKEPLARVALAYVGANLQAEQLYERALNEPALPPDQRQNLIEDLNEAGFADPRKPTMADLPLIQRRIALIEQLGLKAMDPANAAGFKEAYKDLVKMRDDLLRPPAPPKP